MILCDSCPAGYHRQCAKLDEREDVKEMDFECSVCVQNKISSVSDCISSFEKDPIRYIRHKPLGHDRHGRRYWFLVRRVWVEESPDKFWYYSTPHQLEELLSMLDPADYEAPLCRAIDELKGEIMNQMNVTLDVTINSKPNDISRRIKPVNYLDVLGDDLPEDGGDDAIGVRRETPAGNESQPERFEAFAKIEKYFRLGLEGRFREYRNFYVDNRLALTKKEIKELKDNDRQLYAIEYDRADSTGRIDKQKYVRPDSVAGFLWPSANNLNGSRLQILNIIAQAMHKVHDNIKPWFFHPDWKKSREIWRTKVTRFELKFNGKLQNIEIPVKYANIHLNFKS